jgi:hypothetical protein
MPTPLLPSPQMICIEWLRTLTTLSEFVDRDVWRQPKAFAQWTKPFTVQANPVAPRASAYAPLRFPVIQIDVLGRKIGQRLPWETCFAVAEIIAEQTYEPTNYGELVVDNALPVRVGDISLVRAPSIVDQSDTATLARASLDIQMNYVPIYEES